MNIHALHFVDGIELLLCNKKWNPALSSSKIPSQLFSLHLSLSIFNLDICTSSCIHISIFLTIIVEAELVEQLSKHLWLSYQKSNDIFFRVRTSLLWLQQYCYKYKYSNEYQLPLLEFQQINFEITIVVLIPTWFFSFFARQKDFAVN